MKVAFVGCGGFCSGNHIPNAAANPNFEIVAFCDLRTDRLDAVSARHPASYVTTDMTRIFNDPEVELVVCGTNPDFRLPIMELAVEHGKHLFVEKPMCLHESEVNTMVSLMKKSRGLFMVGFNRPYSPLMRALKPLYQKYRRGNTTIIYRIIGESRLWPKHHYDAVVRRKESTIVHEVTHIFDLLNWLTGSEPHRVYTAGGGNMDNIITLDFPDEVTAVIIAGDNSTAGYPKEQIEVNTNHGTIVGDHFIELTVAGFDGVFERQQFPYQVEGQALTTNGREAEERGWAWRSSVTPEEMATGYYYDRQLKPDKGHYHELEEFRRMICEGRPSETDVVRGALANLIAWRAIESWEKKQPVEMDFGYLRDV